MRSVTVGLAVTAIGISAVVVVLQPTLWNCGYLLGSCALMAWVTR